MKSLLIITPIYPPQIGGPATYAQQLKIKLGKKIPVQIISFSSQTGRSRKDVHFVSLKGNFISRQYRLFRSIIARANNVDLILALDPLTTGLISVISAKLLHKKVVIKFVGDQGWEKAMMSSAKIIPLEQFLRQLSPLTPSIFLTKLALSLADKVITPAFYLKALLHNIYGLNNNKIVVISNSTPKYSALKKEKQIIFVGRLVPWKNVDQIINAFHLVCRQHPDYTLLIVGEGSQYELLHKQVRDAKLQKKVTFSGKKNHQETLRLIAKSQILVLFSSYEGLPHVALEALSVGTIPVLSNIPGNDEVRGAMLVKPGNYKLLAVEIDRLLRFKLKLKTLSKKARIVAQEKYDWDKNLKTLVKTLDGLG